jgi:hypothetical protein
MLTHLELMRDRAVTFPDIRSPLQYTSARIWHCKYRSLAPIRRLSSLQELAIATYPDASLEPIAGLSRLEKLEILHLPKVVDLTPLSGLQHLRVLSLATLPSWDARKLTLVDSLEPLALLPCLQELSLFGVVPQSRSISEVFSSRSLRHIKLSGYPQSEVTKARERLAA